MPVSVARPGAPPTLSTFARVEERDEGGIILETTRTPTLLVGKSWPNRNHDYRLLWASSDGLTLYAAGDDKTLRKSADGGVTWDKQGYHANGFGGSSVFLVTAADSLLTFKNTFPNSNVLMRSDDDGATWTEVYTDATRNSTYGVAPMHATSLCEDPVTGYLYWGEYQTADTAPTIRVFRSTDDGATWSTFHEFEGPASVDPDNVRHVHAIEYDDVMERIVVMVGDDDEKAGIYRVNAAGDALEAIVTNDMFAAFPSQRWARAISYIPFTDYIVWGGDTTSNPYICRMARTEIGDAAPTVERLYRANSTMWFAAKASADGDTWVMTASQESEANRLDSAAHIYSISDQGDTITEVGAVSINSSSLIAPYPIGGSAGGGDTFHMGVYESGTRYSMWRLELARAGGAQVPHAPEKPLVQQWYTQNCPVTTIAAGGELTFGVTTVPRGGNTHFRIHEVGLRSFATNNAGLVLRVRTSGGTEVWTTTVTTPSYRHWFDESSAAVVQEFNLSAATELHFVLMNTSGVSLDCTGHITYGFGPALPS